MRKKDSAASATPTISAERVQLNELVEKVSASGRVDAFENGNGHVVVTEFTRADGRSVRVYVEGAMSVSAAERGCLAALKAMVSP